MRKKSVYLRFFAPFSGVAQNGKQFECGHTRNFCRAEGSAKMLVGELPKPAELLDKVELLTKWSQKICSGNLSRKKDAHRRHFMAHINRFKFKEVAERRQ